MGALVVAIVGGGCAEKPPVPAPSASAPPPPPPPEPVFEAYSFHEKAWDIYIPSTFRGTDGTYDLVVHFHGLPSLERRAMDLVGLDAVVVAVNHGAFADHYQDPYKDPQALDRIIAFADAQLAASGRGEGKKLGRLALSGWSAGAGSIGRILGFPGNHERIDALLLEDGLFTSYSNVKRKVMNMGPLERFVRYAQAASRGEKLMVITHSAVPTYGYPSMIETTTALLSMSAFERKEVDLIAGTGMHQTSECHMGSFHLMGFSGDGVQAHMDHVQKMGETSWPYLKARWSKKN